MAKLRIVTGPMFAEKTESIIKYLRQTKHTGRTILVIKPERDIRETRNIFTRIRQDWELGDYENIFLESVSSFDQLESLIRKFDPHVLAIDEIHLFDDWLKHAVKELIDIHEAEDFNIIAAGLDMDHLCEAFEITAYLMGLADVVQKETTPCFRCKIEDANLTYKKRKSGQPDKRQEVGDKNLYEARCRTCHRIAD